MNKYSFPSSQTRIDKLPDTTEMHRISFNVKGNSFILRILRDTYRVPKAVQGIPSLCFVGGQTQEWMQISDLLRVYILRSPTAISAQDSNSRDKSGTGPRLWLRDRDRNAFKKSSIRAINIQIFLAISMQKDTFHTRCLIDNKSLKAPFCFLKKFNYTNVFEENVFLATQKQIIPHASCF